MYASIPFTSSWSDDGGWFDYGMNKFKGSLFVYGSTKLGIDTTNNIRKFARRQRPNESDHRSFPSGHATSAGSQRAVASRNLQHIEMPPLFQKSLQLVTSTAAAGTLWARVEARAHYPTDVLVGYSVGSFISGIIYDTFMNLSPNESFGLYPGKDGAVTASYNLSF